MNAIFQRTVVAALVATAWSAPLVTPAGAQDRAPGLSLIAARPDQAAPDLRASKVVGMDVRNANGDEIGEIQDLIVDVKAERVHYAVLSFGSAAGLGNKLAAFPISTFKRSGGGEQLVLDIDKEKLKSVPSFERNRWPDLTDNRYRKEVDRYFKANAPRGAAPGERLVRASTLIGKEVEDPKGAHVGEIEDLVVNLASERVRYVVLDFDKKWSPDDMLVTLPLAAFRFPASKDRDLVLEMTREQVSSARRFEESAWPDLNARHFRGEVDAFIARFKKDKTARGTSEGESSGGSR